MTPDSEPPFEPGDVDEDADGPHATGTVLGALGQIAGGVLVVAVLILVFIIGSIVVRRLFE